MMTLFSMLLKFSGNYPNNLNLNNTDNTKYVSSGYNEEAIKESVVNFLAQAKNAWVNLGASIVDFFQSYKWKEIIFALKTISLFVSIILLLGIIFVILKMWFGPVRRSAAISRESAPIFNKKKINKKISKIYKKIESKLEESYKIGVIEMDVFFDAILKDIGYEAEKKISNRDDIKAAKKIKANIIDDSKFKLTQPEAEQCFLAYKKGLEELGAI